VASGTGPAYNSYPTSPTLATGVWYCLTSTFANDTIKAYINGNLVYAKYWLNQYPRPFLSALALRIGRTTSFSNPYRFNGVMDDLQIWDGALTQTQILNMCGPVPPPASGRCSIDDIHFSSSLSTPFTYTFTPSITVTAGLPPMNIRWSWGDGSPATFSVDSTPISHTFPSGGGSYYICAMTTAPCTPTLERCFQMCLSATGAKSGAGNGGKAVEIMYTKEYEMGIGNPYPTPTSATLNIPVQNIKGVVKMVVTSINGAVMLTNESQVKESTSMLQLNTDKLAPGIYLLEVTNGGQKITKRLSKL
jgi:hypothetical protein